MAYCGCATSGGKMRWCSAMIFLGLGITLMIAYITQLMKCKLCEKAGDTCVDFKRFTLSDPEDKTVNLDGKDVSDFELRECSWRTISVTLGLAIVTLILATIPCCACCCCASKPSKGLGKAGSWQEPTPYAYATQANAAAEGYSVVPGGKTGQSGRFGASGRLDAQ